jgi:hypothetical protein
MEFRQTVSVFFDIIFIIILSKIILHYSFFIHQKISIGIIFTCLIIFFIISLIYSKNIKEVSDVFKNVLYFFLSQLFYSFNDVLSKKFLDLYIEDIYLFLFKKGICGLIPLLLYDIIALTCCKGEERPIHGIFFYFKQLASKSNNFLSFFADLFFGFIWELSLWLTIYYFSPCHFIILDVLGEFSDTMISIIFRDKSRIKEEYQIEQDITFFTLYPIIIFFVFVFNEIIILDFCGLSYNTRLFIEKREEADKGILSSLDEINEMNILQSRDTTSSYIEEEDINNKSVSVSFRN